ncbi:DCXR [Mytilus edulis]|uniref:DCXR n=1 Tax=Mytilus edulis TaxID=6550 RepID=A0A8S3THY8_MYTED|nr:DCXR [Mytilus edulis]
MEIKFDGKKALVTGAGKGIGRAIAKKLVECGAETYALSRTQSDLDILKKEVPSINVVQIDLQQWDKTRETIAKIGPIDLLINNAGVAKLAKFTEMKKEDLDYVMDVNFNAVFNVSQVVAKAMVERGEGGSIVNISSAASQDALMDHAAYCPSKAAVDMLTKCMALELGPHKIRQILTKQNWSDPAKSEPMLARIPLGKFIEVEDVVNSVIFLLSDKSAMTTGECVRIDGGLGIRVNSILPTIVFTGFGKRAWSDSAGPMLARISLGRFAEIDDVVNTVIFTLSDKSAMTNGE